MLNFFKRKPVKEIVLTDAQKLVQAVEKNNLLESYREFDEIIKKYVMCRKDFTDRQLYNIIYQTMWDRRALCYSITIPKGFTGCPRPELTTLFELNGFSIVINTHQQEILFRPSK